MVLSGEEYVAKEQFRDESAREDLRPIGFRKLFEEVKHRINKASERNKKYYNLRRRSEEFSIGQEV